jgi:hypothetical protein
MCRGKETYEEGCRKWSKAGQGQVVDQVVTLAEGRSQYVEVEVARQQAAP